MPARNSSTTEARFHTRIDRSESGCWLWTGAVHRNGYGGMWPNVLVHRFAWELANGPVPDGMMVLHRCDVRTCVNPDHLFLGTHDVNMSDMVTKGRSASGGRNVSTKHPEKFRGVRNGRAKLTEDDVRAIRAAHGTVTQREMAQRYGVHASTIERVLSGVRWPNVA
jgi:predicted DNA-binding protein (UPF0251 family)